MAGRTGYNSEDDSARTAVAGQIETLRVSLQGQINSLSGGGDPEIISALQDAVDALEIAQADLAAAVAGKADAAATAASLALKATTTALADGLALKASQVSLDAVSDTASSLSAALAGKASTTALSDGLATKASASSVSDLTTTVAGKADATGTTAALAAKADASAMTTALAGKAPNSDITADRARLSSLEAKPTGIQFPQARGAVVFTWDDGWDTHPGVADMHAARGQAATFYVTKDLLDTSQHMASSAVAGIMGYSVGHEIGSHSKTHTDMTTLNATTRAEQWDAKTGIEALMSGGKKITSYAYPLGNNNLACNQEAYTRFDRVAAIGLSQGYYTGASGYAGWLYDTDFEGFRHGRFPWSETTHAQFMLLLKDHVRRRPVILTAYAHQVGAAGTPTLTQVTEALDYCQANGIPCLTTAQAFPGPKLINPGFEDGLEGWTTLLAGAAATGTTVDVITDTAAAGMTGTKSLRIISPNTTTSADSVRVFQVVPAKPMTAYSVSARVRHDGTPGGLGTGASKFSVRINEYNSVGGSIASRNIRGNISTGSWAQSSTPAQTADATNYVAAGHTHPDCRYVEVSLYVEQYTGTFYADHVHFGPTEDGLLG